MTRPIKPVVDNARSPGYPPSGATDRRTFLRLTLACAGGAMGGFAVGCGTRSMVVNAPAAAGSPCLPASRRTTAPPATAPHVKVGPRTRVTLYLAVAPGYSVIVESKDPRFLALLDTPRSRRDLIFRKRSRRSKSEDMSENMSEDIEEALSNLSQRGGATLDAPVPDSAQIAAMLIRYYRIRSNKRTSSPEITLLYENGDSAAIPGFTPKPSW
jgi:hypothetical protein